MTTAMSVTFLGYIYLYDLQEEPPPQRDKNRKVQAVFVDSWRPSNAGQSQAPPSPKCTNSHSGHPNPGQLQHLSLAYNQVDKFSSGHNNHSSYGKLHESGENSRVTFPAFRSRLESDPIDRGDIPPEALHGKVESLENSLDQIYRKMKTDLRDVRDSIKTFSRYSAESSSSTSPLPPTKNNNMHPFRFPRTTDHVDV